MSKKTYSAPGVSTVGPYSPAVEIDGLVYFSGQIPIDYSTGKLVEGDIQTQTRQCFKNLNDLLESSSVSVDEILKATVYLADIADFKAVNEVYAEFFKAPYPARTAIAVAALPLGARIEIEVIAKRK